MLFSLHKITNYGRQTLITMCRDVKKKERLQIRMPTLQQCAQKKINRFIQHFKLLRLVLITWQLSGYDNGKEHKFTM